MTEESLRQDLAFAIARMNTGIALGDTLCSRAQTLLDKLYYDSDMNLMKKMSRHVDLMKEAIKPWLEFSPQAPLSEEPFLRASEARAKQSEIKKGLSFGDKPLDLAVRHILGVIRLVLSTGQQSARITEFGFSDSSLYAGSPNAFQSEVMARLRDLGYSVEIKVEERQLVDIYLLVSWAETEA